MSDSEKPFACSSPGCNMSFINEDHLTVHKKKHDMILNFGINGKSSVFVADQTPTPTRFIRNCEEVGLFQDLQNVNPFEETFRRAVEAGKTGSLAVPEVGISDDTLHTPHIFPHIAEVPASNNQLLPENDAREPPTISIPEATNETTDTSVEVCTSTKINRNDLQEEKVKNVKIVTLKETRDAAETIVVQEANTSITTKVMQTSPAPQLSINGEEVQLLLKTANGKLMQLSAVPVSESHNSTNSIQQSKMQTVVMRTESSLRCDSKSEPKKFVPSRLSVAKMKLKQVLTKNSTGLDHQKSPKGSARDEAGKISSEESKNNNVDQHKKLEILERNRASSMRSRAKRKAWIQQLVRTVSNVNETNTVLQMEVRALRSEVVKLKTLLLAHKDCPITRAMEKGNGIIVEPKVISINPEVIQSIPMLVNNGPIKRTVPLSEVPILAKKKPSMTTKNSVILPKTDANAGITQTIAKDDNKIINNLPTVNLVEVGHFVTENSSKQFLIVQQNSSGKVNETSPAQVTRINPSFEMENAASKSTGT